MSDKSLNNRLIIDDLVAPYDDDKYGLNHNLSKPVRRLRRKTQVTHIQKWVKDKLQNIKKHKTLAVNKIITNLRNNPKFIIKSIQKAMQDKALIVTGSPKFIGVSIKAGDIPFLLIKGFKSVLKHISFKNYQVSCTFTGRMLDGTEFVTSTSPYQHFKSVFHDMLKNISKGLEQYDEFDLSTMEISYTFIDIPTGSGNNGTTSRDKLSILNKTSVINIKNNDNNCLWYALVPQVYKAHPKYSEIVKGRPIREKLAK